MANIATKTEVSGTGISISAVQTNTDANTEREAKINTKTSSDQKKSSSVALPGMYVVESFQSGKGKSKHCVAMVSTEESQLGTCTAVNTSQNIYSEIAPDAIANVSILSETFEEKQPATYLKPTAASATIMPPQIPPLLPAASSIATTPKVGVMSPKQSLPFTRMEFAKLYRHLITQAKIKTTAELKNNGKTKALDITHTWPAAQSDRIRFQIPVGVGYFIPVCEDGNTVAMTEQTAAVNGVQNMIERVESSWTQLERDIGYCGVDREVMDWQIERND
ncbi:hypothetical protein HK100_011439 [Physocladia obscura]|uniref:Uncharacterized protein n=1 Tax=Physocladia obscura TaxID=109957 RepID=A0AAD5T164_9FUNG|nr:hypothetical protein HK100_011439 [Physocladia obscura]